MKDRTQALLKFIIEEYINTAEPVGSSFVTKKSALNVSPATIRNEMRDLEEAGYLTHPHTSAGRIPTEKGYQYYVEMIMEPEEISKSIKKQMSEMAGGTSDDRKGQVKNVAKFAAEHLASSIIVAFHPDSVYYTGISYLFAQPEFRDSKYTVNISKIFDHCEEHMDEMYSLIGEGKTEVLIGDNNPFGSSCGLVGTRVGDTLFTVLAPIRMNYAKAVGLLTYIHSAH
jgi:transcriptional regulator of heat shock response